MYKDYPYFLKNSTNDHFMTWTNFHVKDKRVKLLFDLGQENTPQQISCRMYALHSVLVCKLDKQTIISCINSSNFTWAIKYVDSS